MAMDMEILFTLEVCTAPYGYIPFQQEDEVDCNDNDSEVYPYELDLSDPNWMDEELCNGKVDRCENDIYGDITPPNNELDDDGDGYVECVLDVAPLQWADPNATKPLGDIGGGDCEDDVNFYPEAIDGKGVDSAGWRRIG